MASITPSITVNANSVDFDLRPPGSASGTRYPLTDNGGVWSTGSISDSGPGTYLFAFVVNSGTNPGYSYTITGPSPAATGNGTVGGTGTVTGSFNL